MALAELSETAQFAVARVFSDALGTPPVQKLRLISGTLADIAMAYRDTLPGSVTKHQQATAGLKSYTLRGSVEQSLPRSRKVKQSAKKRAIPTLRSVQTVTKIMRPKGPGCNDQSLTERVVNIVTSLPFVAVGLHTIRHGDTAEKTLFGASLMAVGASAAAYHAASGGLRTVLRKADYYTISAATTAMTRSLHSRKMRSTWGRGATAASLVATPFRPTLVTACHAASMEIDFAKGARQSAELRRQHWRHSLAAGMGVGCFLLEDLAIRNGVHWVHSLWHCLACYGIFSVNHLLQHQET